MSKKESCVLRLANILVPFAMFVGFFWWTAKNDNIQIAKQQEFIGRFLALQYRDVTSFMVHPTQTYTHDYHEAIELIQEEQLVQDFFQAISDSQQYYPQHDVALAQWGMQITTHAVQFRIGWYIPDIKPHVVVGHLSPRSETGTAPTYIQSEALLQWYHTYVQHWTIESP